MKFGIAKSSNPSKIKQKFRKYKYLDFGFTCTIVDVEARPQFIICLKVLTRESMLPNKIKWHFETIYGNFIDED